MFDDRFVQCEARAFFETVRAQFKLRPEEDFAVYHFPPGPMTRPSGVARIRLSQDRIEQIERIGCLVNQPFLYLHSFADDIDIFPMSDDELAIRNMSDDLKLIVAHKNKWRCYQCSDMLSAAFETVHVIPAVNGRCNNEEANLQAVCLTCYRAKTSF